MIVQISNFFNHHQFPVAQQLFAMTEGEYRFVELMQMPNTFKVAGYPQLEKSPMLVQAWKDKAYADNLINGADIILYGNISDFSPIRKRLKQGKLTFEVGERWLKRGLINILSPRLLKNQWLYHTEFFNKPLYRLCSSAYAANDLYALRSFKNKCFKWGYFTKVDDLDVEKILNQQRKSSKIKILSVARFLKLKHPDLQVRLARKLKDNGVDFELNMYGSGNELENTKKLARQLDVVDCVNFCGNCSNDRILEIMRQHHIFLFTSDRHEGWGAVVNEAMSNCCAVVAGSEIGSVPFLIQNKENGMIFKDRNLKDLTAAVTYLIEHPDEREAMVRRAYSTMHDVWSPRNAAQSLLKLIDRLQGKSSEIIEKGPCSPAIPI